MNAFFCSLSLSFEKSPPPPPPPQKKKQAERSKTQKKLKESSSSRSSDGNSSLLDEGGSFSSVSVSVSVSAQDGIVALGKAHTRSVPSLSILTKVALETVPIFVWLNTDRSRPWRVECRSLPFSTSLGGSASQVPQVSVQLAGYGSVVWPDSLSEWLVGGAGLQ